LVGGARWVNLIESLGGGFKPRLYLTALDFHGINGIRIEVQISRVVDGHIALRHVGEVITSGKTALERRTHRQHRNVFVLRQIGGHVVAHILRLGLVDDLDGRNLAHVGEVGVHLEVGAADRRFHIRDGGIVFGFDGSGNAGVGVNISFVGVLNGARFH